MCNAKKVHMKLNSSLKDNIAEPSRGTHTYVLSKRLLHLVELIAPLNAEK